MSDVIDAGNRFLSYRTVQMDPVDVADLARLRVLERNLQRPILNILHVVAAAEELARKAQEHTARGYEHIRVGAIDQLVQAVKALQEAQAEVRRP